MNALPTLLAILAVSSCADGQAPLKMEIKPNAPVNTQLGTRIGDWSCKLNRGLGFIVEGSLDWIRSDAAGNEVLIARNKKVDEKEKDHYEIDFSYDFETFVEAKLIIKSVRDVDQAKWLCRATIGEEKLEMSQELNIYQGLESLTLQLGSIGPYSTELTTGVQLEEGKRGVHCNAKGSNPPADIRVLLNNVEVPLDELNSIKDPDNTNPIPAFHTVAVASVDLTGEHTEGMLKCVATVPTDPPGLLPSKTVSIQLDIITFKPSIHCQNKTTSKGDKYVVANCVVSFTKPFKEITLEVGDTNEIVPANADFDNGDTKFITERLNSTAVRVTIDVYQMADHHFQHVYYVNVLGHDNKKYREPVIFINAGLNKATGGAEVVAPTGLLVVLAAVIGRCLN